MLHMAPAALVDHYLGISRLLAGQLDFRSAIRAVAAEVAHIIPHDHLDVCMLMVDGNYHTAYETGMDTAWGDVASAPVANSPIRSLLRGEVDYMLTDDAMADPRFHFEGAFKRPIVEQTLRSRLHVPLKVQGTIIAALSCSSQKPGIYTMEDVERACIIADLLAPFGGLSSHRGATATRAIRSGVRLVRAMEAALEERLEALAPWYHL